VRTLVIDIETSPNLAHVWSLWDQNVSLSQLQEVGQVISFAAKWLDTKKVEYRSDFHDGHEAMIRRAHEMFDEADAIIHYNGNRFDVPHLHREFLLAGLNPPSPHKNIDLLKTVKARFRFVSNKLQHVSTQLDLGGKVEHTGHDLWVRCMAGDPKAWALFKRYNIQDVVITERLYYRLLPWIVGHPHRGLIDGVTADSCGKCGGTHLQRRGFEFTSAGRYQRFQCQDCAAWSRGGRREAGVGARPVAA
jgi:DNA polymerase elongation subunit (family B)